MTSSERANDLLRVMMNNRERRHRAGPARLPSAGRILLEILLGKRSRRDLRPRLNRSRCYRRPFLAPEFLSPPSDRVGLLFLMSVWWPIRRSAQMVFAEALGQGLAGGFGVDRALTLAAAVNPSFRFRRAIGRMQRLVEGGYPLASSLSMAGAWVVPGLLAALRVGEEQGGLGRELIAFARKILPDAPRRFRRAVGRSARAMAFAEALARRLAEHHLDVDAVRAAGLVAAAGSRRFARVVREVVEDVGNGTSLGEALNYHPGHFDVFYCVAVGSAATRAELRACLECLGGDEGGPRVLPSGLLRDDRAPAWWVGHGWLLRELVGW